MITSHQYQFRSSTKNRKSAFPKHQSFYPANKKKKKKKKRDKTKKKTTLTSSSTAVKEGMVKKKKKIKKTQIQKC